MAIYKLFFTEVIGLVDILAEPFIVFPYFPGMLFISQAHETSNIYLVRIGSS